MVKFFLYSIYNNNKERMENEEVVEEVVKEVVEEEVNIQPEQKKVKSKSPSETNDDPAYWNLVFIRNTRNSYLNLTDKYLLPDYPITDENKEIIINYRQYLRDFMNINKEAILNGIEVKIDPIPII